MGSGHQYSTTASCRTSLLGIWTKDLRSMEPLLYIFSYPLFNWYLVDIFHYPVFNFFLIKFSVSKELSPLSTKVTNKDMKFFFQCSQGGNSLNPWYNLYSLYTVCPAQMLPQDGNVSIACLQLSHATHLGLVFNTVFQEMLVKLEHL